MNEVVNKLAALGVPGLVLLVAIATSGAAGGAAIVAALATLGGPLGMLGGIAVLGIIGLVAQGVSQYGVEALFKGVVERLRAGGKSHDDIRVEIERYPITRGLKRALLEHLERLR
jgi:hypothetical protein